MVGVYHNLHGTRLGGMSEPAADVVQDDAASSKRRRQSRTYDTPCEGFSAPFTCRKRTGPCLQRTLSWQLFKDCCKAWMAGPYPGVEVGGLATPWRTGQELRSTCFCCEHTECHSRNGTAFQLRGKTVTKLRYKWSSPLGSQVHVDRPRVFYVQTQRSLRLLPSEQASKEPSASW